MSRGFRIPFALNKETLSDASLHICGEDDIGSGSEPFCCIGFSFDCIVGLDWPIECQNLCPDMVDPIFSGMWADIVDIKLDQLVVGVSLLEL